jgi:hypothetical protein
MQSGAPRYVYELHHVDRLMQSRKSLCIAEEPAAARLSVQVSLVLVLSAPARIAFFGRWPENRWGILLRPPGASSQGALAVRVARALLDG